MNKNMNNVLKILEDLNLKSTAKVLMNEIQTLNNSNNIIDIIYNKLNQNVKQNLKNDENQETNQKINKNNQEKILDNLVDKLCKKVNFDEDDQSLKMISNTTVFKQLMIKLDQDQLHLEKREDLDENKAKVENNIMEDDLPRFGCSSKKAIDANRYDSQGKERLKSDKANKCKSNSLDEQNHENSAYSNPKNRNMGMSIQNPNNTMTKNESQNDDSLFKETEEKIMNKYSPDENLEKMLNQNNNLLNMMQIQENIDSSSFFQNSHSIIIQQDDSNINLNIGDLEEYVDDDDPGFDLYECYQEYFKETCKKLSEQFDFPRRAIAKTKNKKSNDKDSIKNKDTKPTNEINSQIKGVKAKEVGNTNATKGEKLFEVENSIPKIGLLPNEAKFLESGDAYYPLQYNNLIYDCFNLKVVIDRERTGFEETKEFKIVINSLVAGKYQILEYLGSAAFSKAIKCLDIQNNKLVCLKIIENNKDYIDQSIDEIKLLRYLNANCDPDEKNVLRLIDCFYHKEHLFIVTELLKDNLYEFYKYINENNFENYFNLGRLQKITKQILIALEYIHSLKIVHCDLKPENILIKSINNTQIKVIDFGSSCFLHDHLSSYVQSRSYRAPEVILGCKYDNKIDMWSLGCILAELYTGSVIFQNDSIQSLLTRIIGIIGPIPEWMYDKGKLCNDFFTKEKLLFMEINDSPDNTNENMFSSLSKSKDSGNKVKSKKIHILIPKRTSLRKRLKTNDENFYDFIKNLLEIDPNNRISSQDALKHPWIVESKYELN